MSSCLLVQSLKEKKVPPTLSPYQPTDVTVWQSAQATFRVEIATPGVPAEYTYQWYRDGAKWTGATNASVSWSSASIGTHSIYCVVSNAAGEVTSRTATLTVKDPTMYYSYTGTAEKIDDGNGNWRIKLKTSGTFKFTSLGSWNGLIDVFCVGGGGGGGTCTSSVDHDGGGGGGYTTTQKSVQAAANTNYIITIGAGGAGGGSNGSTGGTTSAFSVSATGGQGAQGRTGGKGGSGGGGGSRVRYDTASSDRLGKGGNGGSDGANGSSGSGSWNGENGAGGAGQGTTTREFGESSGILYSGGGGGAGHLGNGSGGDGGGGAGHAYTVKGDSGTDNLGGGGGAGRTGGGAGGSGIVVIRNHR